MGRLRLASSGRASRQYLVWAQRVSRRSRAERVWVMEGWRETMRIAVMVAQARLKGGRISRSLSSHDEQKLRRAALCSSQMD